MTSFRDWIVAEFSAVRAAIASVTADLAALAARVDEIDDLAAPPPGATPPPPPAKPAEPAFEPAKARAVSQADYRNTLTWYHTLRQRHPGMHDAEVVQMMAQQSGGSPSEQTIRVRLLKCGVKMARRPGRPLDAESKQILRLEAERLRQANPSWAPFRVACTAMRNLKLVCSESHACSVIAQK